MALNSILNLFNGIRSLPGILVLHNLYISTLYVEIPNFIGSKSYSNMTSVLPHSISLISLSSLLKNLTMWRFKIIRFVRIFFYPAGHIQVPMVLNVVYIWDQRPLVFANVISNAGFSVERLLPDIGYYNMLSWCAASGRFVGLDSSYSLAVFDFFWYKLIINCGHVAQIICDP